MKKTKHWLLWADALLLLLCHAVVPITDYMLTKGGSCFSLERGLICPACGGTHCLNSLFRGDLAAAFQHNPAMVLGTGYLLLTLLIYHAEVFGRLRLCAVWRRRLLHPAVLFSLTMLYMLVGFARNLY